MSLDKKHCECQSNSLLLTAKKPGDALPSALSQSLVVPSAGSWGEQDLIYCSD